MLSIGAKLLCASYDVGGRGGTAPLVISLDSRWRCCELQTLATLSPVVEQQSLNRRLGGPETRCGRLQKFISLPRIEPRFYDHPAY